MNTWYNDVTTNFKIRRKSKETKTEIVEGRIKDIYKSQNSGFCAKVRVHDEKSFTDVINYISDQQALDLDIGQIVKVNFDDSQTSIHDKYKIIEELM
jgi:hypothetical protein